MTTLIVYPDADPESATVDGRVTAGYANQDFSFLVGASGNASNDASAGNTTNATRLEAGTTTDKYTYLTRSIYLFDTSSIPSGATISAITFSLYGQSQASGLGTTTLEVVASAPASNTTLANGDYETMGASSYGSVSYAGFSTSGYNDISLSGGVTKAGITKLGTILGWDLAGSFGGTWSSGAITRFVSYYADQAGTTNDPKLTVVYSSGIDVTADLVTVSGDLPTATALIDYVASVSALTLAGDLPTPTVKIDYQVTPGVLTLAGDLPAPLAGVTITVDADLVSVSGDLPTATALIDHVVRPAAVDAAGELPEPTVTIAITPYSWKIGSYVLTQPGQVVALLAALDGTPERRGENYNPPGLAGRVHQEKPYDQRVITVPLTVTATTRAGLMAALDALNAAISVPGLITITRGMADETGRTITAEVASAIAYMLESHLTARFVIELLSPEPYWTGQTLASETGDDVEVAGYFSHDYAGTYPHREPTITVSGDATDFAVLCGIAAFAYAGSITAAGGDLVVDCETMTATYNGADVTDNISGSGSALEWALLLPGSNTIAITGSGLSGVSITVEYYPRFA